MEWFKHYSVASEDDKLVKLSERFGLWGIGLYWRIVESVARQVKRPGDKPEVLLSRLQLQRWGSCYWSKVEAFLKVSEEIGLWTVERVSVASGSNPDATELHLRFSIPKLLQLAGWEEAVKKGKRSGVAKFDTFFEGIWQLYPKRSGKSNALRHFHSTVKEEADFERIQKALKNYLESGNVKNGYIKNGSTWFNEWQDWVEPSPEMMKGNVSGKGYHFDSSKYPTLRSGGSNKSNL